MKYKVLTTFLHDQLGRVEADSEIEMDGQQAQTPLLFGWVDPIGQKPAEVQSEQEPAAPVKRSRKPKDPE